MMNESEIYGEDSRVKWLDKIMNETQLKGIIRNRHSIEQHGRAEEHLIRPPWSTWLSTTNDRMDLRRRRNKYEMCTNYPTAAF